MDILLVVRWPVGGIRTYLKYMLRDTSMAGKNFTVLAPDMAGTEQLQEDLKHYPVTFVKTDESIGNFSKALYKQITNHKYDLIHAHGMTAGALCALVGLRKIGTPIIMSAHDVFHKRDFIGTKGVLFRLAIKFIMARIKVFNTLGEEAKANLFEYYPNYPAKKVVTIRNGIDTESFFNATPQDLRSQLNAKEDEFFIGFLGRFMGQKGFKYLFEALQNISKRTDLNKKPIIVAIDAASGFEREERKNITDNGLDHMFRFIPFTSDVGGLLKGLDLVIMPSVWECCPLMPMETLSAGTAFAGSDCIGLNEVLQGTPATIFKSQDSNAIENTIVELMNTPELAKKFKDFAPTAKDMFKSSDSAQQLADLYDRFNKTH